MSDSGSDCETGEPSSPSRLEKDAVDLVDELVNTLTTTITEKTKNAYQVAMNHFKWWLRDFENGKFENYLVDCTYSDADAAVAPRLETTRNKRQTPILFKDVQINIDLLKSNLDLIGIYAAWKQKVQKSSSATFRSAFMWYCSEHGIVIDDAKKLKLKKVFIGLKNLETQEQTRAGMRKTEGLPFAMFQWISLKLLTLENVVLELNVSHIYTGKIALDDLAWKNDALVVHLTTSKGNQSHEHLKERRHIYANPLNPAICPVLYLGIYIMTRGRLDDVLFLGVSCAQNADAFYSFIRKYATGVLSEYGLRPEDIGGGTHSLQAGAASFVLNCSLAGPSAHAIGLRAGWSTASLPNRKLKSDCEDRYIGRCVTGLPVDSHEFSVLPPHFDTNAWSDQKRTEVLLKCFGNVGEKPLQKTKLTPILLHSLASVVKLHASSILRHVFLPTFWNRTVLLPGVTFFHTPCHVIMTEEHYLYWIHCIQSRRQGFDTITPAIMVEVLTAYVHTMHYRSDTIQDSHGRAEPMESFDVMFVRKTMDCEDGTKAIIRLHQQLLLLNSISNPLVIQLQEIAKQYVVGACLCTAGSAKAMFTTDEGKIAHMIALFVPNTLLTTWTSRVATTRSTLPVLVGESTGRVHPVWDGTSEPRPPVTLDQEIFSWYSSPKQLHFYRSLIHLYLPDQRSFSFTTNNDELGIEMNTVATTPNIVRLVEQPKIPNELSEMAIQSQRFEHPLLKVAARTFDPSVQYTIGQENLHRASGSMDVFVHASFDYKSFFSTLTVETRVQRVNVYKDAGETLRVRIIW